MTPTTHPAPHACSHCRLRFSTTSALRRHDALDHRPAPDGALLTAQVLQPVPPAARVAAARLLTDDAPVPDGLQVLRWRVGVLLVVALLALAPVSPLAAVALLLLAFWARTRIGRGVSAGTRRSSTDAGTGAGSS